MNEYHFYDTSSLLKRASNLFDIEENIVISTTTLKELELIKTSNDKAPSVIAAARQVINRLDQHPKGYEVVVETADMLEPIKTKQLQINNDTKILGAAIYYDAHYHPDETIFYSNDKSLRAQANLFFGEDSIRWITDEEKEQYTGYKEIIMDEDEMAEFYSWPYLNPYNLYINQYLIIKDSNDNVVDKLVWTGSGYRKIAYESFNSQHFGKIKPYPNDVYQQLVADSLTHNQLTMLKGPAGTGKSYLALGYLFSLLEAHKIDKIIVFCNTVAVRGAARLGYYPGDKDEKLLDSQIGNLLSSKLGDKTEVERLITDNKLVLLPLADARGYDTTGMRAGIYISEAQNMDINLMKLSLQRIGEDSICIIDGDDKTQVDDIAFAGVNNGMRRASEIIKGQELYGEVELKLIHRSKIAAIAEAM